MKKSTNKKRKKERLKEWKSVSQSQGRVNEQGFHLQVKYLINTISKPRSSSTLCNVGLPDTLRKSSMEVMSSTASVSTRTCFSHWSLNKSMLSWATLLLGLAARAKAALITCNYHKQPINPLLRCTGTKNHFYTYVDWLSEPISSPQQHSKTHLQLFQIMSEIKPCLFRWKDTSLKPQDEGIVIGAQIKMQSKPQWSEGGVDIQYCRGICEMLRTWGQSVSSWEAAIRTNFTPSSLFEMEHARLATYNRK